MRVLALLAALALFALPARAAEPIDGKWKGTYDCAQGRTDLTLTLKDWGGGKVTASFQFRIGGAYGSFRMRGAITPEGELKLEPTIWITRPEGYQMVGLAGRVHDGAAEGKPDALLGDIVADGCGQFALEKQ